MRVRTRRYPPIIVRDDRNRNRSDGSAADRAERNCRRDFLIATKPSYRQQIQTRFDALLDKGLPTNPGSRLTKPDTKKGTMVPNHPLPGTR